MFPEINASPEDIGGEKTQNSGLFNPLSIFSPSCSLKGNGSCSGSYPHPTLWGLLFDHAIDPITASTRNFIWIFPVWLHHTVSNPEGTLLCLLLYLLHMAWEGGRDSINMQLIYKWRSPTVVRPPVEGKHCARVITLRLSTPSRQRGGGQGGVKVLNPLHFWWQEGAVLILC